MPVDTSIYSSLLQPPKNLIGYAADLDQADAARTQAQLGRVNLIGAQQSLADQQAVRALYQRPGFDPTTAQGMADLSAASPPTALATRKALLDNSLTQANTAKATADTGKATAETAGMSFDQAMKRKNEHLKQLVNVTDVPGAVGWVNDAVQSGELPMQQAQQVIASLQSGQLPVSQWRQRAMLGGLSSQEQLAATKPVLGTVDTGGAQQFTSRDPLTGAVTMNGSTAKTVSPDTAAREAGENARATAGRAVQLKLGGYDANGNMLDLGLGGAPTAAAPGATGAKPAPAAASPMAGMVDAIGTYKTPEGVALGRVPPAMKSQVLAAVMQRYPDYDPSTYAAKQKAARDFTSGSQGNALRSFAVAGQHLDQLGTLVDALDNGNYQIVNKIGNAYAAQTGSTAPTNFDAAKDVVSKEVVKAIVAGGGGVAEREELSKLMSNAKSPAQLKGVISQYRGLMAAQHDALLQQRRAAGLPDSTLPTYSAGDASASGAGAGFTITHVDGKPF